jgi:hypothetical protein
MRPVIAVVVAVLAASCSSGGATSTASRATPHGVYFAWVTIHGQQSTVWLDAANGRYLARSETPAGHGAPHTTIRWIYDGRSSEIVFGKFATTYEGSVRFVAEGGAPPAVKALRRHILGAAPMPDTTVAITRRLRRAPAGLFALPAAAVTARVKEIPPGVRPQTGPAAYWLGPRWRHRRPEWATETVLGHGRAYGVTYAGLDVDSLPRYDLGCDATPTALVDGTLARVVILAAGHDGSFECELSDPPPGSASGQVLLVPGSVLGSTLVVVTTPDETIELSGPALTPQNAFPLARALRPV